MAEEGTRVVSRRDPITTTVTLADGSTVKFEAREIPRWRGRNDLANAIIQQYAKAMNEWLHSTEIDGEILLEGSAFEEIIEYDRLFHLAYGGYENYTKEKREVTPPPQELLDAFERLDYQGMLDVLVAALEVNGLERQAYMLDRSKKDQRSQETSVNSNDGAGQKMESLPVSG
jgi:hypothetical protein